MRDWMFAFGGDLEKQPDIVLAGLDGAQSFTLVDLKVTDVGGPTAVSRLHSSTVRFASHSHLVRQGPVDYFGPSGTPPPSSRMRVVTFVVSTFGSISSEGQRLLDAVSRSCGSSVPSSLQDETTWASSQLTSFLRQTVTLAVRRELARALRDSFSQEEAARCFAPAVPAADPMRAPTFDVDPGPDMDP
jgi:hypothetical protein